MLVLDRQCNQGLHKQSKNLDIDHELDLALENMGMDLIRKLTVWRK